MTQADRFPQPIYQQVLKVLQSLDSMRRKGLADSVTAIPALQELNQQALTLRQMVRQG